MRKRPVHRRDKKRAATSITKKLLISMLSVVLIQGVVFAVIIILGGEPSLFRQNSCNRMRNDLETHSKTLSSILNTASSDVIQYEEKIGKIVEGIVKSGDWQTADIGTDKSLQIQIMKESYEEFLTMMRRSKVSGAFLILGDEDLNNSAEGVSGFYLRDMDPDINLSDNDLILLTGPGELAVDNDLALDNKWSFNFSYLDEKNGKFYYEAVQSVEKYNNSPASKLGYWSQPFKLKEKDTEVVTYSIPLLGENREIYGVMGVEISMEYLKKYFQMNIEVSDKNNAYLIASVSSGKNPVYTPLYKLDGTMQNTYEKGFQFKELDFSQNVYKLEDDRTYASSSNLNLYDRTSPYVQSAWTLVCLRDKSVLFSDVNGMFQSVFAAFILSMILSVCVIILFSMKFINPIVSMMKRIRNMSPVHPLVLEKPHIRELDELADAVMMMDVNVRTNASKVAAIVDLVHLPLGVVEYDPEAEFNFCTEQVLELLDLNSSLLNDNHIPRKEIEEFMKEHNCYYILKEEKITIIHLTGKKIKSDRWIRFISQKNDGKTIIALLDVSSEIMEKRKLEHERDHDILTQLLNYRAFRKQVKEELAVCSKQVAAMVMWDLDNLKYVNDHYGHDFGDLYIKSAAKIFGTLNLDGAVVSRISGDEFMAFIPNCRSKEWVLERIGSIKQELNNSQLNLPDGKFLCIRATAGISWYPDDAEDYETLKKKADFAMYDTKNTYKGFYKVFNETTYERDAVLLESREELNRIIEEEALKYAFQPIVEVISGEVVAFEALMRPQSEQLKTPTDLMRVASTQSKLFEIERLTTKLAMAAYASRREAFGNCKLFINSIPNQFFVEQEVYKEFYGRIVIEIIENEQTDAECMEMKREWANKYGAGIALDDYGTGYNSESTLLYIAPQYVKIDMGIIQGISEDTNRRKLVQNIVSYAKMRDIKIIAEGVETEEDLETLIELDVDYIQGFYVGRPNFEILSLDDKVKQKIVGFYEKFHGNNKKMNQSV